MIVITPICYKYKFLKNGEYPIKIRLSKDKQIKYINLGISVPLKHWDFSNHCLKPNASNKELIDKIIADTISEIRTIILEFKAYNKEYTLNTIIQSLNTTTPKTVDEVFKHHMETLKTDDRIHYRASVKQLYNSLLEFNKHLKIPFSSIDTIWLKAYESYLRKKKLSANTIGIRFRTLRMIYNLAIEMDIVKLEHYPFKKFKISKFQQEAPKRALTKEQTDLILNYDTKDKSFNTKLAIDLAIFSYYMGGINFTDMARLKDYNIYDGTLVYYRKKTSGLIRLPLHPNITTLLDAYKEHRESTGYLFPILSKYHQTERQKINKIHKAIEVINKELVEIGKELELPIKLTTYVLRHSYATTLKRAGISTSIISETLGHSSEKVTQHYLDSFGNEQIKNALSKL